jgi:hypothetical protein
MDFLVMIVLLYISNLIFIFSFKRTEVLTYGFAIRYRIKVNLNLYLNTYSCITTVIVPRPCVFIDSALNGSLAR